VRAGGATCPSPTVSTVLNSPRSGTQISSVQASQLTFARIGSRVPGASPAGTFMSSSSACRPS
jgi:hypothetical protein